MRISRFLLLVLLLAFAVSGVSAQDDPVTLVLMGHSSSPAEDEALQAQIAAFEEAYPNIDVDVQLVPEYETVLQTSFASGDYPNVFYVGQEKIDEYVRAGVIAPVEDNLTDVEDIYPSLLTTYTYEGTLYCPAKDFSNLALEYNKDLFDEAGVEYPTADWTWDDLRAAAEQITENTEAVGIALNPDIDRWFALYAQAGGQLYDEDGNFVFGSEGANYDAAVAAMNFYADLYQSGLARTSSDLGAGWPGDAFGQGLAAMTIEGNWMIQYLLDTFPELNWGVAELPTGPEGTRATLTFSECYGVAADNEHPEESWLLVDFLTGPEGAARLAEGGFGPMPTRASTGDLWLENRGEDYAAFVTGSEYALAPVMPPGFQEFRDTLGGNIQQVAEGNLEAEEAVEEAVEVAQELLEE
jgi:multiple sugar transport system substrate-binding protein